MATNNIPVVDRIRILPRPSDFLDRTVGSKGEVFYSNSTNSLRIFNGSDKGGVEIARADLSNVSDLQLTSRLSNLGIIGGGGGGASGNASITVSSSPPIDPENGQLWFDTDTGVLFVYYTTWLQPSSSGAGGGSSDTFSTISIDGSDTIVADGTSTLNFIAGSNINLISDNTSNTITISAVADGGQITPNSFTTMLVSGQNSITADSPTDTLTFAAGDGIAITTNEGTDTITITSTAAATQFSTLQDVANASVNVADIYEAAITMYRVDNSGTLGYTFAPHFEGLNPSLFVISGLTVAFDLSAVPIHPFEIQDSQGIAYNTGLVHVATDGTVSVGAAAQGKTSGVLYWRVPESIFGTYRYQCQTHSQMVGAINIKRLSLL